MNIGFMIKEARGNLSQIEFAKKIGISRSYLCEIEKNRKSPSVKTLSKLAKAMEKELKLEFVKKPTEEAD